MSLIVHINYEIHLNCSGELLLVKWTEYVSGAKQGISPHLDCPRLPLKIV